MTKNEISISDVIKEPWECPEKMFDIEWTKSTLFLLPMVDVDINKKKEIIPYLENCYIKDEEYDEEFIRPLFILLKTKSYLETMFRQAQQMIRKNPNYCCEYDVGENNGFHLVMFILQTPEKYKQDYYAFKQARYTEIQQWMKDLYPRMIYNKQNVLVRNIAYHASNRTEELQKAIQEEFLLSDEELAGMKEIWDAPSKEREHYRYTKK